MKRRIVTAIIAVAAVLLCGCFSLGVDDEQQYSALFDKVIVLDSNLNTKKYDMSEFVAGDDCNEVFARSNYRYIALLSAKTFSFSEFACFLKGDEYRQVTVNFYITDELPTDKTDADGNPEGLPNEDSRMGKGDFSLSDTWTDNYMGFDRQLSITKGEYLLLEFVENNNFVLSADGSNGLSTTDDINFCADKLLIYVEDEKQYVSLFNSLTVFDSGFNSTKYDMNEFNTGEDCKEVFTRSNYRYIALLSTKHITFKEFSCFLIGDNPSKITVNFYITSVLPTGVDIDGNIIDAPSEKDRIATSQLSMRGSWAGNYVDFDRDTIVRTNEYLLLEIVQNNNLILDNGVNIPLVDDDAIFSADKFLMYVV